MKVIAGALLGALATMAGVGEPEPCPVAPECPVCAPVAPAEVVPVSPEIAPATVPEPLPVAE